MHTDTFTCEAMSLGTTGSKHWGPTVRGQQLWFITPAKIAIHVKVLYYRSNQLSSSAVSFRSDAPATLGSQGRAQHRTANLRARNVTHATSRQPPCSCHCDLWCYFVAWWCSSVLLKLRKHVRHTKLTPNVEFYPWRQPPCDNHRQSNSRGCEHKQCENHKLQKVSSLVHRKCWFAFCIGRISAWNFYEFEVEHQHLWYQNRSLLHKALNILLSALTLIDSKLCHQAVWVSWRPWLVLVPCQFPNRGASVLHFYHRLSIACGIWGQTHMHIMKTAAHTRATMCANISFHGNNFDTKIRKPRSGYIGNMRRSTTTVKPFINR